MRGLAGVIERLRESLEYLEIVAYCECELELSDHGVRAHRVAFKTIIERSGNPCEVLDEDLIIVEHAENLLSLFYSFWEWHGENRFDFFSLCGKTKTRDAMTKELDVIITEMTFHLLKSETDLFQGFQYQRAM